MKLENELKSGRIKKHGVRRRLDIVPRTMKLLRADGWLVAVVEIPASGFRPRQDLFGLWDVLAVKGLRTKVVQVAGEGERLEHHRKILSHENWPLMLATSWELEQWNWNRNKMVKVDGTKGDREVWVHKIDNLRTTLWPDQEDSDG